MFFTQGLGKMDWALVFSAGLLCNHHAVLYGCEASLMCRDVGRSHAEGKLRADHARQYIVVPFAQKTRIL